MTSFASEKRTKPVPRYHPNSDRRWQAFLLKFIKYALLIPLTLSLAFLLYWMISSALKVDAQVYTVPPLLLPPWDVEEKSLARVQAANPQCTLYLSCRLPWPHACLADPKVSKMTLNQPA